MQAAKWILRIGVFGTFLGHGLYALGQRESWLVYLAILGLPDEINEVLIIVIGGIDVLIATIVLIRPFKVILIYAATWAFLTAAVRPATGESFLEFVERSANWAAPLGLLVLERKYPDKPRS